MLCVNHRVGYRPAVLTLTEKAYNLFAGHIIEWLSVPLAKKMAKTVRMCFFSTSSARAIRSLRVQEANKKWQDAEYTLSRPMFSSRPIQSSRTYRVSPSVR